MNPDSHKDTAGRSNSAKTEAERWSAQNEQQRPPMNNAEQRGVEKAHAKNPASGAPESPQSKETFPKRTERPGDAGLANEVRPGLGTRGAATAAPQNKSAPHEDHEPLGRNAPLPPREPREQKPNSLAREQERDTGVSGHSGAD
jgi:hypothetical protein